MDDGLCEECISQPFQYLEHHCSHGANSPYTKQFITKHEKSANSNGNHAVGRFLNKEVKAKL